MSYLLYWREKYFTALDLHSGYYDTKLDEESIPKVHSLQYLANLNFLDLPFGLSQGQDFFICLIYDLLDLTRPLIKVKVLDI